jgi:hypothetical protein
MAWSHEEPQPAWRSLDRIWCRLCVLQSCFPFPKTALLIDGFQQVYGTTLCSAFGA